jgi:hypothetical protein
MPLGMAPDAKKGDYLAGQERNAPSGKFMNFPVEEAYFGPGCVGSSVASSSVTGAGALFRSRADRLLRMLPSPQRSSKRSADTAPASSATRSHAQQ